MKSVKKKIKLATRKDAPEIFRDAVCFGPLAIFPTVEGGRGEYNLTHIPTGMKIQTLYGKKKEIENAVRALAEKIGGEIDHTNIAAIQVLPALKDWVADANQTFSAYRAWGRL